MDISLRTVPQALPGSQRNTLELQAGDAAFRLRLKAGQQVRLRVSVGHLWLTQDGSLHDEVLGSGQQLYVQGPGCYRLSAFAKQHTTVLALALD